MKPLLPHTNHRTESSSGLDQLVEELTQRLQAGDAVNVEEVAAVYPDLAPQLRQLWPGLRILATLGRSNDPHDLSVSSASVPDESLHGVLGDFHILQEIGRGGMGVVYEAEQLSLGRRVALKVLPFAAMLDARQLQRFKNEARAAASLHHPNIVPVYSVGCERGVHYYAMQYIEGHTLTDVINDLRRQRERASLPPGPSNDGYEAEMTIAPGSVSQLAEALVAGCLPTPLLESCSAHAATSPGERSTHAPPTVAPLAETRRIAASGDGTHRSGAYCRSVAQLGIQVAEALEYAHSLGVVHRDIKPSNLILDARGTLWITDFGLAQIESDHALTMTGDVIGTLRYMSPEQAQGQRGVVDRRTDIYSLGVTFYEMLTLQPLFVQTNRPALVQQIVHDEPRLPRHWNSAIPRELETILLKALAKNPAERYATSGALAEDLRRFLDSRPILARRPNWLDATVKWSRRHWVVVAAALVTLMLTTLVSSVAAVLVWRQGQETQTALEAAQIKTREAEFQSTRLAVERALALCDSGNTGRGLNWLAYALRLCPEDEANYQRVIRGNLEAWSHQAHPLEMVLDHPRYVSTAAFTSKGTRLLTSCYDGRLRVWDPERGELLRTMTVEEPPIGPLALAVHPRESLVAVGDWSGRIHVMDIDSGQPLIPPHQQSNAAGVRKRVTHLAFSPNGQWILGASANCAVRLWPTKTNGKKGDFMREPREIFTIGFSPDSETVITTARDEEVLAWSVSRGEFLGPRLTLLHFGHAFAWQDAGKWLIVASEGFDATVWNWETGELSPTRFRHMARVGTVSASEEQSLVATGSGDRSAIVWKWPSAERWGGRLDHPAAVDCVAFEPGGSRLVTAAGTRAYVWRTGKPELAAPRLAGIGEYRPLQLSPDGRIVYAIGEDRQVRAWSTASGEPTGLAEGNAEYFAVSPDGRRLVWSSEQECGAYDLDLGQPLWHSKSRVLGIHFSFRSSGEQMLVLPNSEALLVEVSTGEVIQRLAGYAGSGEAAAFHPSDRWIAIADARSTVRIWDAQSGQPVSARFEHSDAVCDLRFSPDGSTLLAGTKDGKIWLWDTTTHQLRRAPTQLPVPFREMSFHPNAHLALGVAGDGTAQFFDVASGARIGPPMLHDGAVKDVSYTADGRILATRWSARGIRYWRVPRYAEGSPAEIQRRIEALTGMSLDDNETIAHLNEAQWRERWTQSPQEKAR